MIKLTKAVNPGDFDTAPYEIAAIIKVVWGGVGASPSLTITWMIGNITNNIFVPGKLSTQSVITITDHAAVVGPNNQIVTPAGTDYTSIMSALTTTGESLQTAMDRLLSTYLVTKGIVQGIVI